MKNFSSKDIVEYLQKNFTTADGLWFVKIEEILGFERALEIDKEVWKVLPKIQARFIKTKLEEKFLYIQKSSAYKQNLANETDGKQDIQQSLNSFGTEEFFIEALRIKMRLDNFKFRLLKKPGLVKVIINQCPWHEIMLKSKREHLSGKIGSAICSTEYEVFASEFLKNTSFKIKSRICNSATTCVFEFSTI
jgi:hypothetical protein